MSRAVKVKPTSPVAYHGECAWALGWRDAILVFKGADTIVMPVKRVTNTKGGPSEPKGKVIIHLRNGKKLRKRWDENMAVYSDCPHDSD